jgi:MFS family permease|tara:strand:+ start:427 stop:1644 length:1218 start_codon:yes stop_codon:yes gene_type:complete
MVGPIKRDLGGISDTQVSLIMGFAFALFYTLMTYPAGRITDRYNRKNLMTAGIAGWSFMTMLCGAANQYWQLFLARMGVGVGEATLGPASNSALADYFPPERLPIAIGIVASAPFIGQGLANIAGGPLIDYLEATPNYVVPVLGEIYSWQMVLMIVGAPGLLIALAVWFLIEPERKNKQREDSNSVPLSEVWDFILTRKHFFFFVFLGYLCLATQGWSLFSWLVEYFVRNHGWSRTEIGLSYGSIALTLGIAGSVAGGLFASRMIRRGTLDATLRVVLYSTIALFPLAAFLTIVPNPYLALAMLVPVTFCMAMPPGLIIATLQTVSPNELRGQMVAFYLIAVNFLSYSFAPSLPAVISDFVFETEQGLGQAISLLAVINYSIAIVCIGLSLRYFRDAIAKAKVWS